MRHGLLKEHAITEKTLTTYKCLPGSTPYKKNKSNGLVGILIGTPKWRRNVQSLPKPTSQPQPALNQQPRASFPTLNQQQLSLN